MWRPKQGTMENQRPKQGTVENPSPKQGDVENQSTNVLQLMKEWKHDLQDDLSDTEDKDEDNSAINGVCVPTVEVTDTTETETGQDTTKEVAEQNHVEEPKEAESSRKGSGGTKKPGSGGKVGVCVGKIFCRD